MNSILNPEAPEFHPHLTQVTQGGYSTVNKSIRSSNQMPTGTSYDLFKTYTDFNVVSCQLSENVIKQSNQILVTELPVLKLTCTEHEHNTEKIIDANDSMLDRVNINIDTMSGVNKPSEKFLVGVKRCNNITSWNTSPIIAKVQLGSATFIGAKNIPRPQLNFKDTIDNSENLWVPKIADKPNNIKPLALNILFNDEGEAIGYEHPYKVELELYHPPAEAIVPDTHPPSFPPPLQETKFTFIETEEQINSLVKHLSTVKELAVDVEHHSYRTYQGITCLIQITTNEGGDFIIDTLAVREHIYKLNEIFTDPKKIKVFHGAEMDVLWLQRDFGVYIVGLFDTQQAAKVLNISKLSLKNLLFKYCQVEADKKYQLADWRIRPLPEELIEYARTDTHYLLYIWHLMKAEILEKGAGQNHLLFSVFEQSRQICGSTYNKDVIHDTSHMPLYMRSRKSFNSQQMAALKMLYKWRDSQARLLDESTTYLLPNHMLLSLAETLPREVQGVNACCSPMPPFVKQNLITIHRMLLSCRELPMEPQLYQMPPSISNMVNTYQHSALSYNVHDMSHFPDVREELINLEQELSCEDIYFKPDIEAFQSIEKDSNIYGIVSNLNAEAKMFIPPYDRYRKYRSLAQVEEMKEFKDKVAKIAAFGKGDELIKKEVLVKLQQAKSQIENSNDKTEYTLKKENSVSMSQRKRKMSSGKNEQINTPTDVVIDKNHKKESKNNKPDITNNQKPIYKNVNYRKFYNDTEKTHKQPKMKFKKHK